MAKSKSQKNVILDNLSSAVVSQKAVVLITTKGAKKSLTAKNNQEFRTRARQNQVVVELVKNSLIQKAFGKANNIPELTGQTYLTYLLDATDSTEVEVPKSVVGIIEDSFEDNFVILGSFINGEFKDSNGTIELSKMASKEDSMAMVAGQLSQIISKIARTVQEIPAGLARSINAINSK